MWGDALDEIGLPHIFQTAPVGLCVLDTELRYLWINDQLALINGHAVEAHIGRTVRELLPDIAPSVEGVLRSVIETGEALLDDIVHGRTDADPDRDRYWRASYHPIRDGSGTVVGLSCVVQDITREKESGAALREREAWLERAHRVAKVGTWTLDLAEQRVSWSDEMYEIFGVARGEFDGSVEASMRAIHPEDLPKVQAAARIVMEEGRRAPIEYRVVRPDGTTRIVWAEGDFVAEGPGAPKMIGTVQDITERRQLAEQLALSEQLTSLGTLAAGVAHEINNPLTYVLMSLELAEGAVEGLEDPTRRAELAELLADARDGVERVAEIVEQLSTFSRVRDRETVVTNDLADVLEAAVRSASNELRHRARLVRDYSTTPPVVGNPSRLTQVFLNLLVNAAQAIPEGRAGANEIRLRVRVEADTVAVSISDTGAGIAESERERIFEPFYTTKSAGVGTGLGLPLSREIVDEAGGRIEVTSTVGEGTTFTVLLARAESPVEGRGTDRRPQSAGRGARILVVDDEAPIRRVFQRALKGHEVVAAGGGDEALELMSEQDFDLVFCDLLMPDMSGVELYAAVQERHPHLAARFVFMTGGAFTETTQRFLESLSMQPLRKPLSVGRLREVVRSRLGERS